MNNNNKGMSKKEPRIWNGTEENLLKKWGEQAASYRILHNRAYRKYKYLTAIFTIPVIIISTLTGTANFSQGTIVQIYPSFEMYLPLMIGALNLISGIITTIGQFLRVSELNEAHRNSSISYGKFARNISTELSLPPNERTYSGLDFIQICRNEMDRLIEQSPEIGMEIITKFERNKKFKNIIKPEVINISSIVPYQPTKEEQTKELVADAANKFRDKFMKTKIQQSNPLADKGFNNIAANKELKMRTNVQNELSELVKRKGVSNSENKEELNNIFKNMAPKTTDTFKVNIDSLENKTSNNEEQVSSSVKNVKSMFETNANVPQKKILSLAELVQKDNLNAIKTVDKKEKEDKLSSILSKNITTDDKSIELSKLKNSLKSKLDKTKENIENNLDDFENLEEIETNLDEINSVITKKTENIIINNDNVQDATDNVDKVIETTEKEVAKDVKEAVEEAVEEAVDNATDVQEAVEEAVDNANEVVEAVQEAVQEAAQEEEVANQTEEEL